MTETGQSPEPTNADLLEAVQEAFAALSKQIAGLADVVVRAEARLTSRLEDVQEIVQTLKAELAARDAVQRRAD